jgi:asparagine synthase (glutamine-hydrolysing)
VRLGSEFLDDYRAQLDKTIYVTDGAAGPLASHEIYLNARARALAPVRLTGNFGSEVLRAASTFKHVAIESSLLSHEWQNIVADVSSHEDPSLGQHPVTFSLKREIPWNLYGTMAAARSQIIFRTPYLDNELVRLAYRIGPAYRTSPLAALLYVQSRNRRLASIPTDRGRSISNGIFRRLWARSSAELTFKLDYYHKEGLPSAAAWAAPALNIFDSMGILGRHKFLAYRRWFQRELHPVIADTIRQRSILEMPYWNAHAIPAMVSSHQSGARNHISEISAILGIEAIDRVLLRNSYSGAADNPSVAKQMEAAHA